MIQSSTAAAATTAAAAMMKRRRMITKSMIVNNTVRMIPKHYYYYTTTTSKTFAAASASATADSATTNNNTNTSSSNKVFCWLDLRGMGLSMIERLSIEEALLRYDDRNWAIIGTHDVWPHKYLNTNTNNNTNPVISLPNYITKSSSIPNLDCMIVMGIGGKPEKLLNISNIKNNQILVIKRFSGGGTVVLDTNSVWTTLIGRNEDFTSDPDHVQPFPKSIMEWTAKDMFQPTFERMAKKKQKEKKVTNNNNNNTTKYYNTLIPDTKSCSATENLGRMIQIPKHNKKPLQQQHSSTSIQKDDDNTSSDDEALFPILQLLENDYIVSIPNNNDNDNNTTIPKKIGGNAQSIVKNGWLHHTSFLWDYDSDNMMQYLTLPEKRPDYRGTRPHSDFLLKLSQYYGPSYHVFVDSLYETCLEKFGADTNNAWKFQKVTLQQVMDNVIDTKLGGMEAWFAKNRTRILDGF